MKKKLFFVLLTCSAMAIVPAVNALKVFRYMDDGILSQDKSLDTFIKLKDANFDETTLKSIVKVVVEESDDSFWSGIVQIDVSKSTVLEKLPYLEKLIFVGVDFFPFQGLMGGEQPGNTKKPHLKFLEKLPNLRILCCVNYHNKDEHPVDSDWKRLGFSLKEFPNLERFTCVKLKDGGARDIVHRRAKTDRWRKFVSYIPGAKGFWSRVRRFLGKEASFNGMNRWGINSVRPPTGNISPDAWKLTMRNYYFELPKKDESYWSKWIESQPESGITHITLELCSGDFSPLIAGFKNVRTVFLRDTITDFMIYDGLKELYNLEEIKVEKRSLEIGFAGEEEEGEEEEKGEEKRIARINKFEKIWRVVPYETAISGDQDIWLWQ